jgi:hypothetical protein
MKTFDGPLDLTQAQFIKRAERVLSRVSFPMFAIEVREGHGGVYLVGSFYAPDNTAKPAGGAMFKQTTRKWLLSPFMTDSEIVQTAFKMILTAQEHETREKFLYEGVPVYGPHFDVNDLVGLAKSRHSEGARSSQ